MLLGNKSDFKDWTVILGGGLAGLSAGYALTKAGRKAAIFEADSAPGGLSKTIVKGEFRFDLGGHRFFTTNKDTDRFVRELMGGELVEVARKSKIYIGGRFINYPLRPANAVKGVGLGAAVRIVADYGLERLKALLGDGRGGDSLEDWVVAKFGRTLFNIYFKEYSEKVWGLKCSSISKQWVAKRITGLSLGRAIKDAFFGDGRDKVPSLVDRFIYPSLGIGRIPERLKEEIEKENPVFTQSSVIRLNHNGSSLESAVIQKNGETHTVAARYFVSSVPLTVLVRTMKPSPPSHVLDAASKLGYRDLIIAALIVNRERVTDQSWIYIPERGIPLGRIHEPKNWSAKMAPEGKTLIVAEYFCFRSDAIWKSSDGDISKSTIKSLSDLGFIKPDEVLDSVVLRVPGAYPLFEVGYEGHCEKIYDYLSGFENLQTVGRGGMFKYLNMDHAIEAGLEAAKRIIQGGMRGASL